MHASYRFTNLLGATYQGGSVQFSPDGNTLLSPVGNRVSVVDLVQGRTATLPPENLRDIAVLALSSDGRLLLSIDKTGHSLLINFVRGSVLSRLNFKAFVRCARWSPDCNWLAVTVGRRVQIWRAPSTENGWQYIKHRQLAGHSDDVIDVVWSADSMFLATAAQDLSVRLWSLDVMDDFVPIILAEHRSHVRGVFFSATGEYLFSVSRKGVIVSLRYEETSPEDGAKSALPLYCRPGKWSMHAKANCNQPSTQTVTRCAFDAASKLCAVGFSQGVFMLFEVPDMTALQTLSLGNDALDAVALGANGDWLAVGSSSVGQLLVWEWRSETYILKQQGHHYGVQCVAFSPSSASSLKRQKTLATTEGKNEDRGGAVSGRLVATGGYDGKVKVFNASTGLCFITFAEHTAPISGICFTPQSNAVISASKDGSVRAFDLLRYRNFRTFASPDGLCQFGGVAVDAGGEIVAASAASGNYVIYVWSLQTGNILEVLSGHTSFVSTLQFSPSSAHPGQLVTGAWDNTLCVWDLYTSESKAGNSEKLLCSSSVACAAFDPRGNDICAVSCMAGQIQFWNVSTAVTVGTIEGLRDIRSGHGWKDQFSATHMKGIKPGRGLKGLVSDGVNLDQYFSSITYARSGELLLCASKNSVHLCLYDTTSQTLANRFTLTQNQSLSGIKVMLSSARNTETGVPWEALDLSSSEGEDDKELALKQKRKRQTQTLPGVYIGEAKDAYAEKELHVWDVAFAADSQQFAAATTHGVFVFSTDSGLGTSGSSGGYVGQASTFVPQMLTKNVSAPAILKALAAGDLSRAMILALALNDYGLVRKVYEKIDVKSIPIVVASIGAPLLPALLWFLSLELKPSSGTPHFQFHVHWVASVIDVHFATLMDMSVGKTTARTGQALEAAAASRADVAALCLQLLVELSQRHSAMVRTFDGNLYLLRYLASTPAGPQEPMPEPAPTKAPEAPGAAATAGEAEPSAKARKRKARAGAEAEKAPPDVAEAEAATAEVAPQKGRKKKRKVVAA